MGVALLGARVFLGAGRGRPVACFLANERLFACADPVGLIDRALGESGGVRDGNRGGRVVVQRGRVVSAGWRAWFRRVTDPVGIASQASVLAWFGAIMIARYLRALIDAGRDGGAIAFAGHFGSAGCGRAVECVRVKLVVWARCGVVWT